MLPADLPQKTPVCIGQLTVTALVLYPIPYLRTHEPGMGLVNSDVTEWAPVRTQYEQVPSKPLGAQETIHIKSPNMKGPAGDIIQGETFGVVEQKVANSLGPMLGKGLIRIDAQVRRGMPNLPILPLVMLVYTPKGNIPVVGNFLRDQGLLLDHPTAPFDTHRLAQCYYCNPHDPPAGGHAQALGAAAQSRLAYAGPGVGNRWNHGAVVQGKSVEVQRNQADELFKNLETGEELAETEPAPEVGTKLYPHQKKALTFLLERERERLCANGSYPSLWNQKHNLFSGRLSWQHTVTSKEVFEEPREAKGAILADDMGLGKTITCVSLIAATLDAARAFAAEPLPPPPLPPPRPAESTLNAAHFTGAVWGMPDLASGGTSSKSAKAQAKAEREADKQEAEYTRACRVKVRSRATLIICPLSTISNWEDQFREHWKGPVTVVGGGGVSCAAAIASAGASTPTAHHTSGLCSMGPLAQSLLATEGKVEKVESARQSPIAGASRGSSLQADGNSTVRPLRVYVYHGNARRPDPAFLSDFDAVITTYSTLATEYSKQSKSLVQSETDDDESSPGENMVEVDENGNQVIKIPQGKKGKKRKTMCSTSAMELSSPLQSVSWFRVVLDEAHFIKESGTVACRASCDLVADRRICLTGTPVQNKLDDVFALIKFLRLEPFSDKNVWTEYIGTPVKFGQAIGIARLQTIMKAITLRRTKESRAEDGKKILALPPRRDELRYLKFDEQEQKIYDQFFQESKSEFSELSDRNEVMKNYVGILQKILRLRQICDHYELVDGKGPGSDSQGLSPSYEETVSAIAKDGLTLARALAIFSFIRESAAALCVGCGHEFCSPPEPALEEGMSAMDGECAAPDKKRGRKAKAGAAGSNFNNTGTPAPNSSSGLIRPILTRCQHLFCSGCFRGTVFSEWPHVSSDVRRPCGACQSTLAGADAVEFDVNAEIPPEASSTSSSTTTALKKKAQQKGRAERKQKGIAPENFHASTKIKALLNDLIDLSKSNPHSSNYDPESAEIQMVDAQGNDVAEGPVKTIVFSQWTTMLDKIEDALELANIRFDRLDGTMKRDDRVKAMDALKYDPRCEVLLVSLKAGGVGLNLTAASRVYLMDPYWNPAVENQAVDRVHRLGQTRPVVTIKFIIENTIEDRLLKVQKRKEALANMTLGQTSSKAEVVQRRLEELRALFDF